MKTALLILTALLFTSSVCIHLLSFVGVAVVDGVWAVALHVGMFVVWILAAGLMHEPVYSYDGNTKVFWRKHLPKWFKAIWLILFIYGFVMIAWTAATQMSGRGIDETYGRLMANRVFSSGWMFLYSIPFGIFYALVHHEKKED